MVVEEVELDVVEGGQAVEPPAQSRAGRRVRLSHTSSQSATYSCRAELSMRASAASTACACSARPRRRSRAGPAGTRRGARLVRDARGRTEHVHRRDGPPVRAGDRGGDAAQARPRAPDPRSSSPCSRVACTARASVGTVDDRLRRQPLELGAGEIRVERALGQPGEQHAPHAGRVHRQAQPDTQGDVHDPVRRDVPRR